MGGADDDASDELEGSAGGVSLPARVGAARLGVPAVVAVVEDDDDGLACGAAGWSCFHTSGPWKAIPPRKSTPRTPATIFCLRCFSLRTSTFFFAITVLLSRTRCWRASRRGWWSGSWPEGWGPGGAPPGARKPARPHRRTRRRRASPGSAGTS